jgi:hypothetical protein
MYDNTIGEIRYLVKEGRIMLISDTEAPLQSHELKVGVRYIWLQITYTGAMTVGYLTFKEPPEPLRLIPAWYEYDSGAHHMHVFLNELGCVDQPSPWYFCYSRVFHDRAATYDVLYALCVAEDYDAWLAYLGVPTPVRAGTVARLRAGSDPHVVPQGTARPDAAARFRTERLKTQLQQPIIQRRMI